MITAFLICFGSRGDIEPLIALTVTLLNDSRFDKVHFCVQPQYEDLVPNDDRIIIHHLSLNMNSIRLVFAWHMLKEKLWSLLRWESFDIIRAQCGGLTSFVTRLVAPNLPTLMDLVEETRPSFILATSLGAIVGRTIAEHSDLPFFLLHMQPNTPTSSFPLYLSNIPNSRLAAAEIYAAIRQGNTYKTNEAYLSSYETQVNFHIDSLGVINPIRRSTGLQEITREDVTAIFRGEKENQHILQSYPQSLIPSPPDWSNQIHSIPPLADGYIPPAWTAETQCPMLKQFLSQSEKPICITLGSVSMNGREAHALQTMLIALKASAVQRIVIMKGSAGLGEDLLRQAEESVKQWTKEHVFWSSEPVQYAWLFPLCSAVICHGGAGTVSAALRAGRPVAIAPIMSDQYFWGDLVQKIGLGAYLEKGLPGSTEDDLREAINVILSAEVQQKALDYSVKERGAISGGEMAATILANSICS